MATTGSFDLNLTAIGNIVNNATGLTSAVTGGVRDQGDLIGLAIALSIALTLIFGVIFLIINFIPALLGKFKGLKHA